MFFEPLIYTWMQDGEATIECSGEAQGMRRTRLEV